PANWSLAVLGFTQFFFGILGVLAISGEYTSGTIRSSLAAVPRRLRLLAAKITVIGLAALLAGEATTLAMFFAGQALLRSAGAPFTAAALAHATRAWRMQDTSTGTAAAPSAGVSHRAPRRRAAASPCARGPTPPARGSAPAPQPPAPGPPPGRRTVIIRKRTA